MKINGLRVRNYKGFADTGWIEIAPHVNVVVGQNNAGKTALLEAAALSSFIDRPNKSKKLSADEAVNPRSIVEMNIDVSPYELKNMFLRAGQELFIPIPSKYEKNGHTFIDDFFQLPSLNFKLRYQTDDWTTLIAPSHQLCPPDDIKRAVKLTPSEDRKEIVVAGTTSNVSDTLPVLVGRVIRESSYGFRAERLNIAASGFNREEKLQPNASNLPTVLLYLAGHNPTQYERINSYIRTILPSVHHISVVPLSKENVQILVWMISPATERSDLSIPLDQCGTGIGQLLAILYVVVTSKAGKTIAIDEPNSFLHPGASRKLIEILKLHDQHQYIIATHAPEIISVAKPEKIHVVTWSDEGSKIVAINEAGTEAAGKILKELGCKLSDVFGMDAVIWVEGQTEAECFQELHVFKQPILSSTVAILPLRNVGDIETRRVSAEAILEIYQRLSTANALLPTTLSIVLDRENRSDEQIGDIRKRSKGLIKFIPRRCYENYLIHVEAIVALLENLPIEHKGVRADVSNWLSKNAGNKKYEASDRWNQDITDVEWLKVVRAPMLLFDLVNDISDGRFEYRKVEHGLFLTRWIVKNDPTKLSELKEFLAGESAFG